LPASLGGSGFVAGNAPASCLQRILGPRLPARNPARRWHSTAGPSSVDSVFSYRPPVSPRPSERRGRIGPRFCPQGEAIQKQGTILRGCMSPWSSPLPRKRDDGALEPSAAAKVARPRNREMPWKKMDCAGRDAHPAGYAAPGADAGWSFKHRKSSLAKRRGRSFSQSMSRSFQKIGPGQIHHARGRLAPSA